jgi:hypothetical protein
MKNFEVDAEVYFQAYEEHEPVLGKIKRKGKLDELGRFKLNPEDERIFYELYTIGNNPHLFSVTTAEWLFEEKPYFEKPKLF